MSAEEKTVSITINGQLVEATSCSTVIEAADKAGIDIPRFCYHKKLSVAANCRMCMVEVENVPKPLPACATPINEGMVVHTQSAMALDAQKGTMEFLLINHPLDCPICDQGGECELQDLAIGYGSDVSRFNERKRVVKDKNIGTLVSTDMTRCIHCTRCVRFGTEVAGVRELGATGRGEFMEIGTYVEKSLSSELSGNVIDLCPVGALNAKPSRMRGRSWEMIQHPAISPHDATGSNLYLHVLRDRVIRVVPRENEGINETWIADRDRFSYEGLYSDQRAKKVLNKQEDWVGVSWEKGLDEVAKLLKQYAPEDISVLAHPSQTTEELYLLQKIMRGIGVNNIDHRIGQSDFRDQAADPLFPWIGCNIEDLESMDAIFIVGSDLRQEQPILAHRIRKAAGRGAKIYDLNAKVLDWFIPNKETVLAAPQLFADALEELFSGSAESGVLSSEQIERVVQGLANAERSCILLGAQAEQHPDFSRLRYLAYQLAQKTHSSFGYLSRGANRAGACLAGMLPHRSVAGQESDSQGKNCAEMIEKPSKVCILFGLEAESDCALSGPILDMLEQAEKVIVFTSFVSDRMRRYADWILPIASYAENEGSYVNCEGRWQSFAAAVSPIEEAKPAWKVLRMLAEGLDIEGCEYFTVDEIKSELLSHFPSTVSFDNAIDTQCSDDARLPKNSLCCVAGMPIYSVDPLVRRAPALQQAQADHYEELEKITIHPSLAEKLNLQAGEWMQIRQEENSFKLQCELDDSVAVDTGWFNGATLNLGEASMEKL